MPKCFIQTKGVKDRLKIFSEIDQRVFGILLVLHEIGKHSQKVRRSMRRRRHSRGVQGF